MDVKDWLKALKNNSDSLSNWIGVGVAILVAVLLFNYFKSINRGPGQTTPEAATTEISQEKKTVEQVVEGGLPSEYTVKKGDSLWKISQEAYGTGYKWNEIFLANKAVLSDPGMINVGQKITLPKVEVKVLEHTVVRGESLWSIGVSVCQNGFVWQRIAVDNNIVNPYVIVPGQELKIVCNL